MSESVLCVLLANRISRAQTFHSSPNQTFTSPPPVRLRRKKQLPHLRASAASTTSAACQRLLAFSKNREHDCVGIIGLWGHPPPLPTPNLSLQKQVRCPTLRSWDGACLAARMLTMKNITPPLPVIPSRQPLTALLPHLFPIAQDGWGGVCVRAFSATAMAAALCGAH